MSDLTITDVDTHLLEDLLVDPLDIGDGTIAVPDRPGLGVELDEAVLGEHEIGVEDL